MGDEEGKVVKSEFISRTKEHHGTMCLTAEPDMVGKTFMAYVWFAEKEKPKLCAIPLLKSGVVEEQDDGKMLMMVPFQVVDLDTAEPVEVDPPVGDTWTMFTAEIRKVQLSDILLTHHTDGSINSESTLRLIELMRNDRKLCLKKHKELEEEQKQEAEKAAKATGENVSNRTE